MYSNNLEIIINSSVTNVWQALTDNEKVKQWMENVKVDTDWKEGSTIKYTCYDTKGNVVTWNGKQMIWDGIIQKMSPNKELTFLYPSKASGLEKEKYNLVELFPEITKINFVQECMTENIAKNYVDGAKDMLGKLKNFLEVRY